MKESRLFLAFIKRNFIYLFAPAFLSLLISFFIYSQQISQTRISQSFKFEYNIENVDVALALAEQAVTELRVQGFESHFTDSKAVIFKSGPLTITIEALSNDRAESFKLLLKETEYLRQNFKVSTLTQPQVSIVEPNILKFILTGVLIGFMIGLIASLFREYFQNY